MKRDNEVDSVPCEYKNIFCWVNRPAICAHGAMHNTSPLITVMLLATLAETELEARFKLSIRERKI